MSVLAVYQSTCKFCEAVQEALKQSLHVTADLLASLENANQAANYEEKNELDNRRELLTEALTILNDREKDIILKRKLEEPPLTLEELSELYDVSRERIRQIEFRAFEKLQIKMRELAVAKGMLIETDPEN